jgi:hypothetical protein
MVHVMVSMIARMEEIRNAFKILVVKPQERRSLEISRRRWEDIIKMYLRETGWEDADWIHLVQDRDQWRFLVETVMNLPVP